MADAVLDAWNLANLLEGVADQRRDAPALLHDASRVTWAAFDARAAALATALDTAGFEPGQRIGVCLRNRPEFLEAMFACFKADLVPVNVNFRYTAAEIDHLVQDADLVGLFCEPEHAPAVSALATRARLRLVAVVGGGPQVPAGAESYEALLGASSPAPRRPRSPDRELLVYTGGTTGKPKGVIYRHGDLVSLLGASLRTRGIVLPAAGGDLGVMLADVDRRGEGARAFPLCPLMHMTGFTTALIALCSGGAVITTSAPPLGGDEVLRLAREHRATSLTIVGDVFSRSISEALERAVAAGEAVRLPDLRGIVSSGAIWSRTEKERILEHLDVRLVDSIGSTEGGMGMSMTTRATVADTARFIPLPGTKVFDENDEEVAPGSGKVGRIAVSANLPRGYHNDAEKTAQTFREVRGVTYSFPGDLGTISASGELMFLGRGNTCINTGGEKVYPEEVEEILKRCDGVQDAAVFGVADARYGQKVVAVLAGDVGLDVPSVLNQARASLAGYKVPREVRVEPQVQRTTVGKVDYAWARRVLGYG